MKSKRLILCVILTLAMVFTMSVPAFAAGNGANTPTSVYNPFSDFPRADFFKNADMANGYETVMWAYCNGITSGLNNNYFGAKELVTRGQVVTFLWRYMGSPEPSTTSNPFVDVKSSDYYYKPVLWAVENNICSGTSANKFAPALPCSYAHLCVFLHRIQGCPAYDSKASRITFDAFRFAKVDPTWYTDAVLWAGTKGIVTPVLPGNVLKSPISPANIETNCPRIDVVSMIYNFEAEMNNKGYYPNLSTSYIMKNPKSEVPNVTKSGRDNGKDYFISLDAAGTQLLGSRVGSNGSYLFEASPYDATTFRVLKIGDRDTLHNENGNVTQDRTANNSPNYGLYSQHYSIQFGTNREVFASSPKKTLDIAAAQDIPGSWVLGYSLFGNPNQLFDLESAGNGRTYIKSIGGNYIKYVEGTGLVLTTKDDATAFYFLPRAQYGY